MTAKKSLGVKRHEEAVRLYGEVARNCEPKIAAAITQVHRHVDAHYAEGKPGLYLKTILPLVRAHVDGPINDWLISLGLESVSFARLLEGPRAECIKFIEYAGGVIEDQDSYGDFGPLLDLERTRTADALIDFCRYCCTHRSDSEQILRVEAEKHNEEIIHVLPKRGKESHGRVRRMEQLGIKTEIDFTSMADEQPYCQLCTDLTMHMRELMRLRFSPSADGQISEEDRKVLATTKLRISILNHSPHYCSLHNPDDEPATGYNKAHARRKIYYSMRRFIILARHARNLRPPYWHILRAAAYLIPDACKDQSLIARVPLLVEEWHATWERPGQRLPAHDKIADLFEQIALSFKAEDHRLAEFVFAMVFKKGPDVYDTAKACGAFPDDIERLIDSDFLPCSRDQALKLGATFFVAKE